MLGFLVCTIPKALIVRAFVLGVSEIFVLNTTHFNLDVRSTRRKVVFIR
jgi:hypothetical protein